MFRTTAHSELEIVVLLSKRKCSSDDKSVVERNSYQFFFFVYFFLKNVQNGALTSLGCFDFSGWQNITLRLKNTAQHNQNDVETKPR